MRRPVTTEQEPPQKISVLGSGNITAGGDVYYTAENAKVALKKADRDAIVNGLLDGLDRGYIAPAAVTQIAGGAPSKSRRRPAWRGVLWPSIFITFLLVAALSQVNIDWLRTRSYIITGILGWGIWTSIKRGWW